MSTNQNRANLIVLTMTFILGIGNILFAVSSGKIAGGVYDAETTDPLPGANVIIEGTAMGAAADVEGNYFILNVRPGTYTVTVSVIGYVQVITTEVVVQVGLTTPLDFALTPAVVEGEVVTVVAERPVIQTDVGNSGTILDGSELAAIPVGNFKEVLDKQMGIQEQDMRGLFMRGQRQNSIGLRVDGMETRDNIDEVVYTRFNPDEIEQVEINAGGYDASSGNATAGVISLITKEGGKTYSGTFDYRLSLPGRKHFGPPIKDYFDDLFLEERSEYVTDVDWKDTPANWWEVRAHGLDENGPFGDFKDRPGLLQELYHHLMRPEVTDYGDKSDDVLRLTLGGPVPLLKNTTFFISGRREKSYYLYPGPLDHFFDQNGMIRLTTRPSKSTKLSINFRYTETTGVNRYDCYRDVETRGGDLSGIDPRFQDEKSYAYEGVEQVAWGGYGNWPYTGQIGSSIRYRNQYGITFTHSLSPRTFYEVRFLANNVRQYGGQSTLSGGQAAIRDTSLRVTLTDPDDPTYTTTLGGLLAEAPLGHWPDDMPNPLDLILGASYDSREHNQAKDMLFRVNITSQVNKYNQLNFGLEYASYAIDKDEHRDSPGVMGHWGIPFDDMDDPPIGSSAVKPASTALWASDKIEFEGLVLTAGLRGDVRIPDEWFDWKHDPWNPLWSGYLPPDSNFAGPRYNPPLQIVVAPRLSVSHPIGETAKIFFNWGHYYQEQPFERQYLYYRRNMRGQITYGDPELPYRKSIQYEVGYEQSLLNVFRIAISAYYKDVKNLLMDRVAYRSIASMGQGEPLFYTYGPNRYLSNQGIEVRLEKRSGKYMTAWFNYTIQIFNRGVYGFDRFFEDTTQVIHEFRYDRENVKRPAESRFNLGVDFHTPRYFGPAMAGFHALEEINLNFLLQWQEQAPFTYDPLEIEEPYTPLLNESWKPHWSVNMTLNKRFNFGRVTPVFYVEVYNLFNTKNMWRGAFNEMETARDKYVAAVKELGHEPGDDEDLAKEAIGSNPTRSLPFNGSPWFLYLNPRQIWAGIRFEFK